VAPEASPGAVPASDGEEPSRCTADIIANQCPRRVMTQRIIHTCI